MPTLPFFSANSYRLKQEKLIFALKPGLFALSLQVDKKRK